MRIKITFKGHHCCFSLINYVRSITEVLTYVMGWVIPTIFYSILFRGDLSTSNTCFEKSNNLLARLSIWLSLLNILLFDLAFHNKKIRTNLSMNIKYLERKEKSNTHRIEKRLCEIDNSFLITKNKNKSIYMEYFFNYRIFLCCWIKIYWYEKIIDRTLVIIFVLTLDAVKREWHVQGW
jgi:hypothetical protein